MDAITIVLLVAYGSLVLELLVFSVPSEASTLQLLTKSDADSTPLSVARRQGAARKTLRFLLPTLLGVLLFLIPLAALIWPPLPDYLGPLPIAAPWFGVGLVAMGRVTTFAAAVQLNRAGRSGGADLVPRGLFRFSRNPILLGMFAFYLGNCCIFPCLVLWVGFLPYALNMHSRVLLEEGHLAATLGPDYEQYARAVPRYLIF